MDPRRGRILVPAAVAILAAAAFAPSLSGGFLYWDDRGLLLDETRWRGFGPSRLAWMFTTFHAGHWQPLTWLSFAVNHALGGLDPFGYRLGNVLLHAAAAVLFHAVLLRLFALALPREDGAPPGPPERLAAGLGALAFAVHPLRAESVAWITERRDVLSGALLLAALLAWLHAQERGRAAAPRRGLLAVSVVLHALSLLAKAWGVTFPVVLLILDLWPLKRFGSGPGRWTGPAARPIWREKIPFLLLAVAAAVPAPFAQRYAGVLADTGTVGLLDRAVLALHGLAFYASKTLLPLGLSPLREIPRPFDPSAPRFLLAGLAVAAAAGTLFALRRRRPAWAAAAAVYAVVLLPVLGTFQSGPQMVADRYTYLACLPFAALAGAGVLLAVRRGGRAAVAVPAAAAAAAGALLAASLLQSAIWQSDRTLWERALAVEPAGRVAADNMGAVHMREGDPVAAETWFRRALERAPGYVAARLDLAAALRRQGRSEEAVAEVERALEAAPGDPRARAARGFDLVRAGRNAEALERFEGLLAGGGDPKPEWLRGRGLALAGLGRREEALEPLRRAHGTAPGDGANLDALATVLSLDGRTDEAVALLREGMRSEPSFGQAHLVLGTLLAARGEDEEATAALREAVRLQPHHPEASWNLAMLLARRGRVAEAIEVLEARLRRVPGDAEATRGIALLRRGEAAIGR